MKLSIRYKILLVLGLMLLLAVAFYTLLASRIFKDEKVALLFDINHSTAVNAASQLKSYVKEVGNEIRLYALSEMLGEKSSLRLPKTYLAYSGIKGLRIYVMKSGKLEAAPVSNPLPALVVDEKRLATQLYSPDALLLWSQEISGTEHFYLKQKIELNIGGENRTLITVAEIEARQLFSTLQSTNLFESYLVDTDGNVLVHCIRSQILPESTRLVNHPLLDESRKREDRGSGVIDFSYEGMSYYGAYAPLGLGNLVLLSQSSGTEVERASRILIHRSILFGTIALTLTFIISILFSKRLTQGIQTLAEGAQRIGKGELDFRIKVKTGDEVQDLAQSFNAMTKALKVSREAIEKHNRELEQKVAERTEQLHETNATIKEVQEKLLLATQLATVGEVAGRTAHEVLNPLTAILNRLERSQGMLSESSINQLSEILDAWENDYKQGGFDALVTSLAVPSAVHEGRVLFEEDIQNLKQLAKFWTDQNSVVGNDLLFVREQAERIHRIIDRMRELARSSVKGNVHCHEAISEAIRTMSDFLSKHGVKLVLDTKAESDFAFLNRDEFVQILTNLIRNSYHAIESLPDPAKRSSGTIRVSTTNDNHELWIDVIDNGIGITPDKQGRLFEQGFTTKGPQQGTGLGLAICRRYARAFSGEVELLFSEPEGRGTCFRVRVPLKQPSASADLRVAI